MDKGNRKNSNKYADLNKYPLLIQKSSKALSYALYFFIISLICFFIAPFGLIISIPTCMFFSIKCFNIAYKRKKLIDKDDFTHSNS